MASIVASYVNTGGSATASINVPATATNGRLLLWFVVSSGGSSFGTPTNGTWTLQRSQTYYFGGRRGNLYSKVAGASESGSYTVTVPFSVWTSILLVIDSHDGVNAVNGAEAFSTSFPTGNVAAVGTGSLFIAGWYGGTEGSDAVLPGTMTPVIDDIDGIPIFVGSEVVNTGTYSRTATTPGTDAYGVIAITIKPAAGGGSQNLTLPHISSTAQTYAGTLTPRITLPAITNAPSTFTPSLLQNIALPHIETTAQLFNAALTQSIVLPHISSNSSLSTMALALNIVLSSIESNVSIYTPSLSALEEFSLTLPFIENVVDLYTPGAIYTEEDLLYPPSITQPSTQNIDLPRIESSVDIFALNLSRNITLPYIANNSSIYNPSLRQRIALPFIASTATVLPTILFQNIILPRIVIINELHTPTIGAGSTNIQLPFIDLNSTVYVPNIFIFGTIQLPFISSGATAFNPTFTANIILPRINSAALLYALAVTQKKTKIRVLSERTKHRILAGKKMRVLSRVRELEV